MDIGIVLGWISVILTLVICLIQIRAKPEIETRFSSTPLFSKTQDHGYVLYADIKNSGLLPISFKVKSHTEHCDIPPAILFIDGVGVFHDGVQNHNFIQKGLITPAYEKVHKLRAGESTYVVAGHFQFFPNTIENFEELKRSIPGQSRIHLDPAGKISRLPLLRKMFSRQIDVDFNRLYVDTAADRAASAQRYSEIELLIRNLSQKD
jgi:hypothetical protein